MAVATLPQELQVCAPFMGTVEWRPSGPGDLTWIQLQGHQHLLQVSVPRVSMHLM